MSFYDDLENKTSAELAEHMSRWISCFKCHVKEGCDGEGHEKCINRLKVWLETDGNLERFTKTGNDGLRALIRLHECDQEICPLYGNEDGICDCRKCFRYHLRSYGNAG